MTPKNDRPVPDKTWQPKIAPAGNTVAELIGSSITDADGDARRDRSCRSQEPARLVGVPPEWNRQLGRGWHGQREDRPAASRTSTSCGSSRTPARRVRPSSPTGPGTRPRHRGNTDRRPQGGDLLDNDPHRPVSAWCPHPDERRPRRSIHSMTRSSRRSRRNRRSPSATPSHCSGWPSAIRTPRPGRGCGRRADRDIRRPVGVLDQRRKKWTAMVPSPRPTALPSRRHRLGAVRAGPRLRRRPDDRLPGLGPDRGDARPVRRLDLAGRDRRPSGRQPGSRDGDRDGQQRERPPAFNTTRVARFQPAGQGRPRTRRATPSLPCWARRSSTPIPGPCRGSPSPRSTRSADLGVPDQRLGQLAALPTIVTPGLALALQSGRNPVRGRREL